MSDYTENWSKVRRNENESPGTRLAFLLCFCIRNENCLNDSSKTKNSIKIQFWFTCIFQVRKFSNMLIVHSAHMSLKSPAKVIVHSKEIYVVSLHDPRTANEFVPILLYKTPCHQKIARQVTVSSLIFCGNRFFGLQRKLMMQLDVSFCIYNLSHSLLPPVVLLETNFLVLNNLLMQLLVCFCFF